MTETFKVRAIQPVQIQPNPGKPAELMPAGAVFVIPPERFSWRFMEPLGWDPASTEGVPPRPAPTPPVKNRHSKLAREIVAEMANITRAGSAKRQRTSGQSDDA